MPYVLGHHARPAMAGTVFLTKSGMLRVLSIYLILYKLYTLGMKEFFKPTRLKIILTLVALLAAIPFIGYDTGIRCITTPCPSFVHTTLWKFMFLRVDNPYAANSYDISWWRGLAGIGIFYTIICAAIPFSKKMLGTVARGD